MEYREMFYAEIDDVATLYNELAFYIKDNTQDDYFDFEILTTEAIIQKLQIIINDPMKKVYVAIEKDKIIGFISGEIIDCFLPISQKKRSVISLAHMYRPILEEKE